MKCLALVFASLFCLGCGAISGPRMSEFPVPDRLVRPGVPVLWFAEPDRRHYPGETVQLAAQVKTVWGWSQLDNSTVTWYSADTNVATVDSDGLVTLLRPGGAGIWIGCETCVFRRDGSDFASWILNFGVEDDPHVLALLQPDQVAVLPRVTQGLDESARRAHPAGRGQPFAALYDRQLPAGTAGHAHRRTYLERLRPPEAHQFGLPLCRCSFGVASGSYLAHSCPLDLGKNSLNFLFITLNSWAYVE